VSGLEWDDDELDGFGPDDDGYDGADELEDAYVADPVATIGAVVQSTAAQVEARIAAQVEAEAQRARSERLAANIREAHAAMDQAYPGWTGTVPSVADALKADAARGVIPYDDAQALAEHLQRVYLAEREKSRPSAAEAGADHWRRVRETGATSYADLR
jgi:hypothetical protein